MKLSLNISIYVFVLLLFTTACSEKNFRIIHGVKATGKTLSLLDSVEYKYRNKVDFIVSTELGPSVYGLSSVEEQLIPTIKLSKDKGLTETTIYHELLHLENRYNGWPVIDLVASIGTFSKNPQNRVFMNWISHLLFDPISHNSMYAKMRKKGFDPDRELRLEFKNAIKSNHYKGQSEINRDHSLTLHYFKALLEIDQIKLKNQIREWYIKNNWQTNIKDALEMYNYVINSTDSPDEIVSSYVKCLNILLDDEVKFENGGCRKIIEGKIEINLCDIVLSGQ